MLRRFYDVPDKVFVLRFMLLPALVAPAVHHVLRVARLVLLRALAHRGDLHAEQALAAPLRHSYTVW